jgi:hypothetical protein
MAISSASTGLPEVAVQESVPEPAAITAPEPAAPAPVEAVPSPVQPSAPPSGLPSLAAAVEEIRKKLASGSRRGISSISVAGNALPLSADEVDAFTRASNDDVAVDLQRSLAARAVLILAMEKRKRTGVEAGYKQVVEMCRAEAEAIQQHAAEKKQPALALSANQLMMLLNQAGRLVANGA